MYIREEDIATVTENADIVDVVGVFVTDLKKVGNRYRAKSPFTNEKTPSFYVTPKLNIFKCFSSGKGGDSVAFLMESQGMPFTEAIEWLAQRNSIELKRQTPTPEEQKEIDEKQEAYKLNKAAMRHWQKNLIGQWDGVNEFLGSLPWRRKVEGTTLWPFSPAETTTIDANGKPVKVSYEAPYYVVLPDIVTEECHPYRELIIKRQLLPETIDLFCIGYAADKWQDLYDKAQ